MVVVNGRLTSAGRGSLSEVADEILERDNHGFDIEAQREALTYLGSSIDDYDEIVLANDTWYGPIGSFTEVFERMDATAADFWGMTDHREQVPNPFTGAGVMHRHLQSFWIAVRRSMFATEQWRRYWRDLAPITSYNEAILFHESVFTETFTAQGFIAAVAFPSSDYPTENATIFHADLLMRDGCPLLKRRVLFHHPTFLYRHAIVPRDILRVARELGYPTELIMRDLARNVAPRTLNADLGLLDVRGTAAAAPEALSAARVAMVVVAMSPGHVDSALTWASRFPAGSRIVVVAARDEDRAALIEAWGAALPGLAVDVRPAAGPSTHPLAGAEDLADPERVDLLVRIDARIWDGDDNEHRALRRQQLESLLGPQDALAWLAEAFSREPGLGLVFPPTPYVGELPEAIRWPATRGRVAAAAERARIHVPIDEFGPLAPAAGVWAARPEAMAGQAELTTDEPPMAPGSWALSDLMLPYLVAECGFHSRTVTTAEHAALAHTAIEYSLDRLLENTYGYRLEQIQFLQRAQWRGQARAIDLVKMHMRINHPDGSHPLLPLIRSLRGGIGSIRRVVRSVIGGR
nr:rhamnan synthesis F family protein [Microbacterium ureisolvens]